MQTQVGSENVLSEQFYEISIERLYQDLFLFADYIRSTYEKKPRLFGVPRGGLIIAGWLSHLLDIREVVACPVELIPLMDNFIKPTDLVVEDIFDLGKTYAKIRETLAPEVRVVSLYSKRIIPEEIDGYPQVIMPLDLPVEVFVQFPWERLANDYSKHLATERPVKDWRAQSRWW